MRAVLACLALSGCAALPWQADTHDPRAVQDAYLIAHGMAQSYVERADANPNVALELTKLDLRAQVLVEQAWATGSSRAASARAVAALTEYAASQTTLTR